MLIQGITESLRSRWRAQHRWLSERLETSAPTGSKVDDAHTALQILAALIALPDGGVQILAAPAAPVFSSYQTVRYAASRRYLTDPEFHARVHRTLEVMSDEDQRFIAVGQRERDLVQTAACVALILAERAP